MLESPTQPVSRSVFISYGRSDGFQFANRLAHDLRRHGHRVWIDLNSIEEGSLFEVRIEHGIRESHVVAAVMTPRSLDERSVCRDEIVFALNEGKTVVPLRVGTDPAVRPTLLLARRNWVDFSVDYETGLRSLLRFLAGDGSALQSPHLSSVTGFEPMDFAPEIARFCASFVGRRWMTEVVDRWLLETRLRALVTVGEPGVGKSSIAAWLAEQRVDVVGIHFCTQSNSRTRDPFEFAASLVAQLDARLPEFSAVLESRNLQNRRASAGDAFRELIVEPSWHVPDRQSPCLIVIDALDEAITKAGENIVDVVAAHAADLPNWLRIMATTRPEPYVLQRIRHLNVYEINAVGDSQRSDVGAFIAARLESSRRGTSAFTGQLERLSTGNFLYAKMTLDALDDGTLTIQDIGDLAPGLAASYHQGFRRRFHDLESYEAEYQPLLEVLAAVYAPVSFELLTRIFPVSAKGLHQHLAYLRPYLRIAGSGETASYALFHKSLKDWLTDAEPAGDFWCDLRTGHQKIADTLTDAWEDDLYALEFLPYHLMACSRWDQLADLFWTPAFLEAAAEQGRVFQLASDLSRVQQAMPRKHERWRILRLLEEAIRRDIHFIARHPTLLFQCLWNSCWWYDCPQASAHFAETGEESVSSNSVKDKFSLYCLLEEWRREKIGRSPGRRWLRSLRPPPLSLGTAQWAVLRGHRSGVHCVACSEDGTLIASSSENVRIWSAETGRELYCLDRHSDMIPSVVFLRGSHSLASGARDGTVRVWDGDTGAQIACLRGHTAEVESVTFSVPLHCLLSASRDRTIRLWNAESWREEQCLCGHEESILAVACSPVSALAASGSRDSSVRLWDLSTAREVRCLHGHDDAVDAVAFSPDGQLLASGSFDATIRIWSVQRGVLLRCLRGHQYYVKSVAISPDGKWLVSSSLDTTIRIWDIATGQEQLCLSGHEGSAFTAQFMSNSGYVVSGAGDHTVRVWDTRTLSQQRSLPGHKDYVREIAFLPDCNKVVTDAHEGTFLWDLETGLGNPILDRSKLQGVCQEPSEATGVRIEPIDQETVLRDEKTGQPFAFFPESIEHAIFLPGSQVLAATVRNHVHLLKLERE